MYTYSPPNPQIFWIVLLELHWKNISQVQTAQCTVPLKYKGLITRIYRELKKLTSQKFTNPRKKWAKVLNRVFQRKNSK
jgi:hypothetical protein